MGIQERGREVTRLVACVDAAFAFAVTLLGIAFDAIPARDRDERIALRGQIAAHAMIPFTGLVALGWIAVVTVAGVPELSAFSGFAYGLMGFTGLASMRAERRASRGLPGTAAA